MSLPNLVGRDFETCNSNLKGSCDMAIRDIDDVFQKLDEISDKLSSGRYGGSVSDKLDKMIELLESIERKLG